MHDHGLIVTRILINSALTKRIGIKNQTFYDLIELVPYHRRR
jgi:hypothetical protein